MPDKTYVITEIVGTSDQSISAAVSNAVERSNKTLSRPLFSFLSVGVSLTRIRPGGRLSAFSMRIMYRLISRLLKPIALVLLAVG